MISFKAFRAPTLLDSSQPYLTYDCEVAFAYLDYSAKVVKKQLQEEPM